jgi:hypothetical protein
MTYETNAKTLQAVLAVLADTQRDIDDKDGPYRSISSSFIGAAIVAVENAISHLEGQPLPFDHKGGKK